MATAYRDNQLPEVPQPTTADKIVHAVLIILPGLIAFGMFLAPAKMPVWMHSVGIVLMVVIAVANRFALPPWAKAALSGLSDEVNKTQPGVGTKMLMAAKKGAKKAGAAAALLLALGMGWTATSQTACNATSQQISTTIADGAKAGVCITIALLSGTDPLSCAGATEQLVVDVVNDIEAQPADAGAAAMVTTSTDVVLTPAQIAAARPHLDDVRVQMVTKLAQKGKAK